MLKIRFMRAGRKNQPFYQIVVTDSRNAPQGGRFREKLGFYNPLTKEKSLDEEKAKHWLSIGAQPSDRIHNMFVDAGIIQGTKINMLKKSKKEGQVVGTEESAPAEKEELPKGESGQEAPPEEKPAEPKEAVEEPPAEEKEASKENPTKEESAEENKSGEDSDEKKEPAS